MRRVIRSMSLLAIALAFVLIGYVGYELWGTGIEYANSQDSLAEEFEADLAESDSAAVEVDAEPSPTPGYDIGDAFARLRIPAIGLETIVVEGIGVADLRRGPGHYPGTGIPGELGNVAIAGHRTTYGQPFHDLDKLQPGDEIVVETNEGAFTYLVEGTSIIDPSDISVVEHKGDHRLTLTACHPKYSSRQRIVVTATMEMDS